jgi:hypothetical protein
MTKQAETIGFTITVKFSEEDAINTYGLPLGRLATAVAATVERQTKPNSVAIDFLTQKPTKVQFRPQDTYMTIDGQDIILASRDKDLLRILMDAKTYVSVEDLIERLNLAGHYATPITLRTQISRLRTKMGAAGNCILVGRNLGYRFKAPTGTTFR